MNLTRRTGLVALIAAAVIAATVGLTYAAFDREFKLPVQATVTVKLVSFIETADVNGDGRVDRGDLRIVASNINTRAPGDEKADVDNNGAVDIGDLAFVARYFGLESTPPTPTSTTPAPKTHDVQATDAERFAPDSIIVRAGDTVVWTNMGAVPHTINFAAGSIPDKALLLGGETHVVTFTTLGAFSFVCEVHPPDMVGLVRVVP